MKYGDGIECSYFISGTKYKQQSHDNNDDPNLEKGKQFFTIINPDFMPEILAS